MALCGVAFHPPAGAIGGSSPRPRSSRARRVRCQASETESRGRDRTVGAEEVREESGHVLRFKMSDFAVSDHVSIGLHGRGDEEIFEATVSNPESTLYNSRVVLRQLTSLQAQRRGRRALEVLKKLTRRRLMYHSYAMQVHGYVSPSTTGDGSAFTLVHGYHGSYSLMHWLQLSDWLPTLEATLALDEEWVKRVGDDSIGGPAVTRQLRLIRILMRDLLIGVNYLHSHGLAHTELRLENVHISPVDRHVKLKFDYADDNERQSTTTPMPFIELVHDSHFGRNKVGILGNAVDFEDGNLNSRMVAGNIDRRRLMIAFDMRCVGFIMVKMVLRELMDSSIFLKFKTFLTKGNDPSCLREFLLPILYRDSPSGNAGLQMLDRNWGAGWNLISLLLATKPSERISCLGALRHPFLCGPRWRVEPSLDVITWGLGSTAVRMAEDYIYVRHQGHEPSKGLYKGIWKPETRRSRIAYFIELMELLNPNPRQKNWADFLPGRWRLLYSTGKHIGLSLRQPHTRVLIMSAYLTFTPSDSDSDAFLLASDINFKIMSTQQWPHDKSGIPGKLHIKCPVRLAPGRRFYLREEISGIQSSSSQRSAVKKFYSKKWSRAGSVREPPFGLPAAKFVSSELEMAVSFDSTPSIDTVKNALQEVRIQIPPEMFDVSKLICGTYVDSRMMVLRGVNGSALLFTRSSVHCT